MNNELRNQLKILDKELYDLHETLNEVESFLEKSSKYYKKEESIKALNNIKKLVDEKNKLYKEKHDRAKELNKEFIDICKHEIVIKDRLNSYCAICDSWYEKKEPIIEIELSEGYMVPNRIEAIRYYYAIKNDPYVVPELYNIYKIIDEGIESNNLISYAEEKLEELQYNSDIKVRRLRK